VVLGGNTRGQLGDGKLLAHSLPAQVGPATDWRSVAAGFDHTCATKTDGTLYCWGNNDEGGLGDGTAWRAQLARLP
jgi:alpha-tubulin suppressor-like RCC1 family protein